MFSFSAVVLIALLSPSHSLAVQDDPASDLVWFFDDVSVDQVDQGLYGVSIPGFSNSEDCTVLLPERTVMIPIPPGESFSVRVIPGRVRSLGATPAIAALEFDEDGYERFFQADLSQIQPGWGEVADSGTFRRAGYIAVRLRPVIVQDGELLSAGSLRIVLDCDRTAGTETVSGHEGEIFRSVFGTNDVWRLPLSSRAESPFWGKPWAKVMVDTAGVYQITGDLIPEAVGMPSSSFSLITGRGRMMSTEYPAEDTFVPREVPVFVDDGGDGTFDSTDRVIFYGRGLSWWEDFQSGHFSSWYDGLNCYWLTWGGEGGPFMDVLDG
ncbi:MAG: hypothetical protein KAH54_01610, partial [Candidatus Sabulitectum sp.]|nr:hypothetical protein [Candidatus Sabulitectum sp.]